MQLRGKAESENEVDYKSNSKRRALDCRALRVSTGLCLQRTDRWKKNASKVGCHLALDRDHIAEDVSTVGRITGEDANNFQPLNRIPQWWKTVQIQWQSCSVAMHINSIYINVLHSRYHFTS